MSYTTERALFCELTTTIRQIAGIAGLIRRARLPKYSQPKITIPKIAVRVNYARDRLSPAKPDQRRRKRMAARSGQRGFIEQKGRYWYVRFRVDVPGQFERRYKAVRLCPVEGIGALSKTERQRMALEIIAKEGANSENRFQQIEAESCTITFREQSKAWLDKLATRKRKPIKPHTLTSWKSHLVWLNSKIGDTPLGSINNLVLRNLVSQMYEAGFAPKTMLNYLQVVKAVVGSLLTDDGEPVFPRKWNHEFIDLPIVKNQHQPTLSQEEIEQIINNAQSWYRVCFCLLAGTGMRAGEALALEIGDIDDGLVRVRQNLFNRTLDTPKTAAGVREIDLAPELAEMLRQYIGNRTSGFAFHTRSGGPVLQRNVLRMLHGILKRMGKPKLGFHAFRRFRVTHLRKNMVPEDIIRFWIGHSPKTVTDVYSRVKNDIQFRKGVAEKVGLGFELPPASTEATCTLLHPIFEETTAVQVV
jgi:integrase